MENGEDMSTYKARIISKHIRECLTDFKGKRPMLVGMQGPQGSGKTTATESVKKRLQGSGCRVAVFSLDGERMLH
jgi:pantothenate kinase-related protein Tda10